MAFSLSLALVPPLHLDVRNQATVRLVHRQVEVIAGRDLAEHDGVDLQRALAIFAIVVLFELDFQIFGVSDQVAGFLHFCAINVTRIFAARGPSI